LNEESQQAHTHMLKTGLGKKNTHVVSTPKIWVSMQNYNKKLLGGYLVFA
jgi:hypothetical protein